MCRARRRRARAEGAGFALPRPSGAGGPRTGFRPLVPVRPSRWVGGGLLPPRPAVRSARPLTPVHSSRHSDRGTGPQESGQLGSLRAGTWTGGWMKGGRTLWRMAAGTDGCLLSICDSMADLVRAAAGEDSLPHVVRHGVAAPLEVPLAHEPHGRTVTPGHTSTRTNTNPRACM